MDFADFSKNSKLRCAKTCLLDIPRVSRGTGEGPPRCTSGFAGWFRFFTKRQMVLSNFKNDLTCDAPGQRGHRK